MIAKKTLPNGRSKIIGRFRLRLGFRWLWFGITAVDNCPSQFFHQFFSCLNSGLATDLTEAAIKLDVTDLA